MANKKLTEVGTSTSFDSVFVNDGGKVRQVSKEKLEQPVRDVDKKVEEMKTDASWALDETLEDDKKAAPASVVGGLKDDFSESTRNLVTSKSYANDCTINGISFTVSDGCIIANGTASDNASFIFKHRNASNFKVQIDGVHTFSGCPFGGDTSTYFLQYQATRDGNLYTYGNDVGIGFTNNILNTDTIQIVVVIKKGTIANNLVFRPQIEYGESKTNFIPHITGKDFISREMNNRIENILDNDECYSISYFMENDDNIHLGLSYDGLNFQDVYEINIGKRVVDPAITRIGNMFYLTYTSGYDEGITIYKSTNLKEWSVHSIINVDLKAIHDRDYVNFWAPELFVDVNGDKYISVACKYNDSSLSRGYGVNPFIIKCNSELTSYSSVRELIFDNDDQEWCFDVNIFIYNNLYLFKSNIHNIYACESLSGNLRKISQLPSGGYREGFTTIKRNGKLWFYGDELSNDSNKLVVFVTSDFINYERYAINNDEYNGMRHPFIKGLNGFGRVIIEKLLQDSMN